MAQNPAEGAGPRDDGPGIALGSVHTGERTDRQCEGLQRQVERDLPLRPDLVNELIPRRFGNRRDGFLHWCSRVLGLCC